MKLHLSHKTPVVIELQTKAELKIERLVKHCLKLNLLRLSSIETVFLQDSARHGSHEFILKNENARKHGSIVSLDVPSHTDSKSE